MQQACPIVTCSKTVYSNCATQAIEPYLETFKQLDDGVCIYFEAFGPAICGSAPRFRDLKEGGNWARCIGSLLHSINYPPIYPYGHTAMVGRPHSNCNLEKGLRRPFLFVVCVHAVWQVSVCSTQPETSNFCRSRKRYDSYVRPGWRGQNERSPALARTEHDCYLYHIVRLPNSSCPLSIRLSAIWYWTTSWNICKAARRSGSGWRQSAHSGFLAGYRAVVLILCVCLIPTTPSAIRDPLPHPWLDTPRAMHPSRATLFGLSSL